MTFKKGSGWKACHDEENGRYTAEYGGFQAYHLYEMTAEQFGRLENGMTESEASGIINDGRHLYMSVNDRCGPPYTVVFDDDYKKLCPWADIISSGETVPDALTDAVVELFSSEAANRPQRRRREQRKDD